MLSFIKSDEHLQETPYVEDCFAYDNERNNLSRKLESIRPSSIVGLIGAFGRGKSTLLHNIKQQRRVQNTTERWVEFEAWQFPNRKDLWEGFTLEVAKQASPKMFESAKKRIDGESKKAHQELLNVTTQGLGALAALAFPGVGSLAGPTSANLFKKFGYFLHTSPARRVFEIQNILRDVINKESGAIYIIVEDVDRSGDYGMNFLETLKQFLKSTELENRVICIAPIATSNFLGDKHEAYLKCLDFIEFFDPKNPPLKNFFNKVISSEIPGANIGIRQTEEFFALLFKNDPNMTLRKLKLILRKADVNYSNQIIDGNPSDWRVAILFETAKYIKYKTDNNIYEDGETYFSNFKERRYIEKGSPFFSFLGAIVHGCSIENLGNYDDHGRGCQITIGVSDRSDTPTAWYSRPNSLTDDTLFCSDLYLDY